MTWWWWPAGSDPGQRPVLFFPPAGAEQGIVRPLLEHLGGLRLGVLRLPGRGTRQHEEPPHDLTALVAAIATAVPVGGPGPVLVGHSFGGLLAYAVAAELQSRGREVARLITLASNPPRRWSEELARERDAEPNGGREAFVARRCSRILGHGGVPAEILGHAEYGPAARRSLAVDVGLSYGGFDRGPLRCPITAIAGRADPVITREAVAGWAEATTHGCDVLAVPGDHFFYRRRPRDLAVRMRMEVLAVDTGG